MNDGFLGSGTHLVLKIVYLGGELLSNLSQLLEGLTRMVEDDCWVWRRDEDGVF